MITEKLITALSGQIAEAGKRSAIQSPLKFGIKEVAHGERYLLRISIGSGPERDWVNKDYPFEDIGYKSLGQAEVGAIRYLKDERRLEWVLKCYATPD